MKHTTLKHIFWYLDKVPWTESFIFEVHIKKSAQNLLEIEVVFINNFAHDQH